MSESTMHKSWRDYMQPIIAAVRRLTPRECERLQGFPEIENYVRAIAKRL